MEQLEQLKVMLGDAQERLKKNPDYKLVSSLEGLISDLEAAFGPIEAPAKTVSKDVEAVSEVTETVTEVEATKAKTETEEAAPKIVESAPAETVVEVVTEQEAVAASSVEVAEVSKVIETSEVIELHSEKASGEKASDKTISAPVEAIVETASKEAIEGVTEKAAEDVVEALNAMPEVAVDATPANDVSTANIAEAFVSKVTDDIDLVQSDALESNLEDALNEMIEASADVSKKDTLEKTSSFSSMAIMATNGSVN